MAKRQNWTLDPIKAKDALKKSGRTREYVLEKTGISKNYLSLVMNGHRRPSEKVLRLLAFVLEVSRDDLITEIKAA